MANFLPDGRRVVRAKMTFKAHTTKNQKISWTNFKGLCKGCGLCLFKCPLRAISWDSKNLGVYGTPSVKVDINKCIACNLCSLVCPDSAIRVENVKKS